MIDVHGGTLSYAMPCYWVAEADVLGGCVYMYHVVRLHDRRRQHYYGAKDAMP